MLRFLSPETIARFAARHPWYIMGLWVLIIAAAVMGAGSAKESTATAESTTQASRAEDALNAARGEQSPSETIVVSSETQTVDSPAYRAYVEELTDKIRGLDGTVTSAVNSYEAGDESLVNADRSKTLISVTLAGDLDGAMDTVVPLLHLLDDESEGTGFKLLAAGDGSINHEINEVVEKDLLASEVLGLPAALIVLIIVFGALVAAGLPLILSFLAVLVAVGITGVVSNFAPMDDYVMNMIIMIGLAVGIDYSLFIVERFREERAAGLAKVDAITLAGATASRAVLFSGITVIIALGSLLIVPELSGLAYGAIAAVIGAVLAALTILPASLSLLGDKVNAIHLPGRGARAPQVDGEGVWGRVANGVMRHPVYALVGSVAVLAVLAAPTATIKIGDPGISQLPQNVNSVKAFNVLDAEFSAGRLAPVEIVVQGNVSSAEVASAVDALGAEIARDSRFSSYTGLQVLSEGTGLVEVYIQGDSFGSDAQSALKQLRSDYIPAAFANTDAEVLVGGGTAYQVDAVSLMKHYLPLVIGFVLTLSFVLLMVVFRSIVIPAKAIVMNLLSVAAAYGVIVAVFQHGIGAGQLGFTRTDSVASFLPAFLFAILFGLSMDYHVFLLSRIQERFLKTGDNRLSVASGLQSTAHIITGAAAIMLVVFGAFALGDLVQLQQMGFGLAVAVFIDATLIRSILVPASMELLGDRNWYLPSWLEWLPEVNIEGNAAPRQRKIVLGPAPRMSGELVPVEVRIDS
ncbi:MAG TPA: MMPL family transporter [Dehalococcoidia bacterium]|nr:MMPL family transporter [Dehalococcoidia bacterium]